MKMIENPASGGRIFDRKGEPHRPGAAGTEENFKAPGSLHQHRPGEAASTAGVVRAGVITVERWNSVVGAGVITVERWNSVAHQSERRNGRETGLRRIFTG